MIEWKNSVRKSFATEADAQRCAENWQDGLMMETAKAGIARKLAEGFEMIDEPTYATEIGQWKRDWPYFFQVEATVMLREKP